MKTTRLNTSLFAAIIMAISIAAHAQPVHRIEEKLTFDRPEAWAMKYFDAVTLLSTIAAPTNRPTGAADVSLELTPIPRLSRAQRTVGFNGTKEEDLNKLGVLLRPRVSIALPQHFSVIAAWVPPVGVRGIRADLFSAAIRRTLLTGSSVAAATLSGQIGTIKGAITCPANFTKFDPQGRYGCEQASSDTSTFRNVGLELFGGKRISMLGGPTLHLSEAANYSNLQFQVNALTFGFIDRRHETAHGILWTTGAGATWPLARRTDLGLDAVYTPLSIRRPNQPRTHDSLFTVRLMLRRQL